MTAAYRGWRIARNNPPIPTRDYEWEETAHELECSRMSALPRFYTEPAVKLDDALRELIDAERAVQAHRHVHDYKDRDEKGNSLDDILDHARRFAVSALAHHGIDADALRRAL
jgi:hypothetical protein